MEVYIEYVIIDNLVIDSLILLITKKINRLNCNNLKVFLITILGTLIALISPLITGFIQIIVKVLCGILMPIIMCYSIKEKPPIKTYIITILSFWLVSMCMAGSCLAICSIFNITYITYNGAIEIYNFPVGLALLICSITYFVIKNIITNFLYQKKLSKFTYKISIINKDDKFSTTAYLDSGNVILDKTTNKPVTLINYELFSKMFPNIKLSDLLLKRYENLNLKNLHEIEVKTLTKSSKILLFEIDNIVIEEINKEYKNSVLGLSLKDFNLGIKTDCILNCMLINEGE